MFLISAQYTGLQINTLFVYGHMHAVWCEEATDHATARQAHFHSAAGQGIGRASALACAAEGAHLIATDINTEALSSLASEDGRIEIHGARDSAQMAAFASRQVPLDGLFNWQALCMTAPDCGAANLTMPVGQCRF